MVLAGMIWICYKLWIMAYTRWDKRGVPAIAGYFPFGSDPNPLTYKKYAGHFFEEIYRKKTLYQYIGIYVMRSNMLVIRDPDIIGLILDKDSLHFKDRITVQISEKDNLAQNLFNLDGERWRKLHGTMKPFFTREKCKAMFPIIAECAENLNADLLSKLDNATFDVTDVSLRFIKDTVWRWTFALETSRLGAELVQISSSCLSMRDHGLLKSAFLRSFPILNDFIPIRFTPANTEKHFMKLVADTIKFREKFNIRRSDLLDQLLQLKKKRTVSKDGSPLEMDIGQMAAQLFAFFLTGCETSSSVQSCCLYELAFNQDVQKRLCDEIDRTLAKNGGLTFDALEEMEYLDMVLSETMRKYPAIPYLFRTCTKQFTMPAGHKVESGECVIIPVWSLHYDTSYFPKPDKFDPERFSQENKRMIRPYTYLPFGKGPRSCIGVSIGLLQVKMGIVTFLRKFKVMKSDETATSLEFVPSNLVSTVKGPIMLKIVPRHS